MSTSIQEQILRNIPELKQVFIRSQSIHDRVRLMQMLANAVAHISPDYLPEVERLAIPGDPQTQGVRTVARYNALHRAHEVGNLADMQRLLATIRTDWGENLREPMVIMALANGLQKTGLFHARADEKLQTAFPYLHELRFLVTVYDQPPVRGALLMFLFNLATSLSSVGGEPAIDLPPLTNEMLDIAQKTCGIQSEFLIEIAQFVTEVCKMFSEQFPDFSVTTFSKLKGAMASNGG